MVDMVMMSKKHQRHQQKQQQQQQQKPQQQHEQQLKSLKQKKKVKQREEDFYYTLSTIKTTTTTATETTTTTPIKAKTNTLYTVNNFNSFCRCCGNNNNIILKYHHHQHHKKCKQHSSISGCGIGINVGVGGNNLWLVLVVFMLILCGNTVISQQRNINNIIKPNNSNNHIANILLQISTQQPPPLPQAAAAAVSPQFIQNIKDATGGNTGRGGEGIGVGIIVADDLDKPEFSDEDDNIAARRQQLTKSTKTTITTTSSTSSSSTSSSSSSSSSSASSTSSRSSSLLSNNAPTSGISNNNNSTTNTNLKSNNNNKNNNNETLLNNGESISNANSSNSNDDNDDNNNSNNNNNNSSSEDLLNSAEILNESEDGYEHSSTISSTTYRPLRSSIAPTLTSAQERERRLMHVLAARRSALQRPGFRNRIGTTGRTATAVETTSKSPTDPRSICIRNCTKNFTRRTTASCMRQCANFSKVASSIPGAGSSTLVVKNSSKTGTGTAQAGEKDTNEILFTDESSHGLLVIAKEQNDTLNHITDGTKGDNVAKGRGRRKQQQNQLDTVTLATTSIEDDEIQPYLYFGKRLPPLRPNTLTITSVSDEHPKLLEVSVADNEPSTTTPVTITSTSTLSAVERSRARFKYNMRNGVSFNRRYTTINRSTTPEVPTELRTTTLRIVAEVVKEPKLRVAPLRSDFLEKIRESTSPRPFTQALREVQPISSSTPLIITVLSDEDMVTPTPEPLRETTAFGTTSTTQPISSTSPITTTTTSTTRKPTTTAATRPTTEASTTTSTTTTTTTEATTTSTTTTTTPASTTTTTTAPITTTTSTTTTEIPTIYQPPITTTSSTTTTTTTTTTPPPPTTTPPPTEFTTKKNLISPEDTEILRQLGPSLTQPINTDDKTNLIIFVNRTTDIYRPNQRLPITTKKPQTVLESYIPQTAATTDSSTTILHTTILTSIRSTINSRNKDLNSQTSTTTPLPTASSQQNTTITPSSSSQSSSSTQLPTITGEISSTVVTDDQEISMEMHRMNIVTMVLAGIGIVPLLAIILYFLRNYLLKRPIKDDEDFDVCITDQQPISPVKKIDSKYQDENEDEVDHHPKKSPQRQHSLHSKLVSAPLARDNNHNVAALNQQRFDDKSSVSSDQEFDRTNIRLKSLLGEGNFGQVWKAEADDLSGHFGATRIVAVKTIKACSTQLSLKDEANIMRKLGSHQNVVTLLGACVDSEPHMLIMEYAMRGRLLSLLRAARNATNILPASVPGGRSLTPLSPRTLAGFCLDIARGMEYISEKRIVHRDLAARNVLLDHNGVCKICDFGMSIDLDAERKRKELEKNCANEIMRSNFNKFKFDFGGKFIMNHWPHQSPKDCNEKKSHGHDTIGKRPALPIRWMAPEALQYNIFSTETDIWAFGIVLWEIATLGSTPYSQITGREVIRRVPQGLRPDLPKEGRHEFYNLMSRCWHKDPHMRPSFCQCRLEISRSLHKWVDDDSAASDYMDVSGFSEDLEQGMVYFNHRISEFECEI